MVSKGLSDIGNKRGVPGGMSDCGIIEASGRMAFEIHIESFSIISSSPAARVNLSVSSSFLFRVRTIRRTS